MLARLLMAVAARVLAALVRSRAVLVVARVLVLLSLGLSLGLPLVVAGLLVLNLSLVTPLIVAWALGLRMSTAVRVVASRLMLSLLRVEWSMSPLSWRFLFHWFFLFNRSRLLMAPLILLPWVRLVLRSRAPLVVASCWLVLGVGVI